MSECEYLAVFMSIIYANITTHVMAGNNRSNYSSETKQTHYVLNSN